jgi:hypothetical protein
MITAPTSSANSRPMYRGTRIGSLVSSVCAIAGQPLGDRGGIIVGHAVNAATAALDCGDCRLRCVGDVDAGAQRDLSHLKEAVGIRTRV